MAFSPWKYTRNTLHPSRSLLVKPTSTAEIQLQTRHQPHSRWPMWRMPGGLARLCLTRTIISFLWIQPIESDTTMILPRNRYISASPIQASLLLRQQYRYRPYGGLSDQSRKQATTQGQPHDVAVRGARRPSTRSARGIAASAVCRCGSRSKSVNYREPDFSRLLFT
ncbi:hypothetical protein CIHG_00679 [Coccidioides immitis H538.4]|uniref:Uncharacterized protein n=1 Tax=Coccidioides immitis H538.4 TaxID=396776 RepID=A0A0J8RE85_COCIT|nr:hypothetical protein CIHG_00679 [Coccidioides immitis H538.4]